MISRGLAFSRTLQNVVLNTNNSINIQAIRHSGHM